MNHNLETVKGQYESKYQGNPLWENLVRKLTVRQAYVFHYSLACDEKNKTAIALGILDLPDRTMVHKCLMDTLLNRDNPKETAQIIGDNAHKILISDNDLLWFHSELRAALWLSFFIAKVESGGDKMLLDILRSTSRIEFTNRLTHVLDIYGCSYKGDNCLLIQVNLNNNNTNFLDLSHPSAFNKYRGDYVLNRINDSKLNWLNKLPEDEIDIITDRFRDEKILLLDGIFVPIIKKDKVELIKASLDLQKYRDGNKKHDESILRPYTDQDFGCPTKLDETVVVKSTNNKKKKDFVSLSADEISDLLKKAYSSRKHRQVTSHTKMDGSLTLKKESHTILIALSKQLGATPKKIVEALIRGVDLENKFELSKINENISGRRATKTKSLQEEPIIEPEPTVKPEPLEVKSVMKKSQIK